MLMRPRVIPVFVVQQIVNHSRGAAQVLGLSAGPPGGLSGTSKGGLVVNGANQFHNMKNRSRTYVAERLLIAKRM